MLSTDYIPKMPFASFKWKWASLQCTEGINDPVVLLGVLFRMRKLEPLKIKYSSDEFAKELINLSNDIKDSINVDLARRTGERNLIRNSGQYWRSLGLIPPAEKNGIIRLTEFGRMVADRKISQTEFAAITIQTFSLPNPLIQTKEEVALWNQHGIKIYPLKLILEISQKLAESDSSTGYITPYELYNIVIPLSAVTTTISDYVTIIRSYRRGNIDLTGWPNCVPAANDKRIAREYLLFLSNYGYINSNNATRKSDEKYFYSTNLDDEITEILTHPFTGGSLVELARNVSNVASEVERKRVKNSRYRPHQAQFRKEVLSVCKRCVITNVTMPEILEAAHIKPFKYNGEDTVANGFAMRTDIHLLFDSGHLRISEAGDVVLSDRARMDYGALIPPKIVIPDFTNREFLRWRWDNYNGI